MYFVFIIRSCSYYCSGKGLKYLLKLGPKFNFVLFFTSIVFGVTNADLAVLIRTIVSKFDTNTLFLFLAGNVTKWDPSRFFPALVTKPTSNIGYNNLVLS